MDFYKGKSKCSCGSRAKYRVIKNTFSVFACEKHKDKLNNIKPDNPKNENYTEADFQTWMNI